MSKILYSVELERFFHKDNEIYWLSGWCFSESGEPVSISVWDERGRNLPVSLRRIRRTDVSEYFPQYQVPAKAGFEVELAGLNDVLRTSRRLLFKASDGSSEQLICRRSKRDLQAARRKCAIASCIDELKKPGGLVKITGWAYGSDGPCDIELLNEDGSSVPCQVRRIRRKDIEQLYRMEDRGDLGFTLTADASLLKGQVFRVRYTCAKDRRDDILDPERGLLNPMESMGITYSWTSAEKWRQTGALLKRGGLREIVEKLRHHDEPRPIHNPEQEYETWFAQHRVTEKELQRQREEQNSLACRPKISIAVPLYNTKEIYLRALLQSVQQQSYENWQLCLADGSTSDEPERVVKEICGEDPRVRYERLAENKGIAGNTNAAIAMADGDYIMLADHDDLLEPDALFEIASAVSREPDTDIIYTDEDLTDETGLLFRSPRFKPDFNLDFLRSINYICHIFVVRTDIMKAVGGFRSEYDGAQDWDMILRCCEKAEKIRHIPRVLYHWRAYEESTAGNPESKTYAIDAGRRALEAHFARCGLEAELEYTDIFILFRPVLKLRKRDKISIIICTRDEAATLDKCVTSILEKSTYDNYEIIIVENNSEKEETFALYRELCGRSDRIRVVTFEGAFNYSAVNNFGASFADGEYLLLLNNDTEVITPDWLERMLANCQREDVAAVGAKLLYPDDTVQHCGVVVGLGGFAGHILTGSTRTDPGYFGRLQALQDVSAVTAACVMVSRKSWDEAGGLDETYTIALNDIDFCLRLGKTGQLIVLDPGVELYHYESKSRGFDDSPEKKERFKKEIRRFRERWNDWLEAGDPFYSPNLTLRYNDCRIRQTGETFEKTGVMAEIVDEDQAKPPLDE